MQVEVILRIRDGDRDEVLRTQPFHTNRRPQLTWETVARAQLAYLIIEAHKRGVTAAPAHA